MATKSPWENNKILLIGALSIILIFVYVFSITEPVGEFRLGSYKTEDKSEIIYPVTQQSQPEKDELDIVSLDGSDDNKIITTKEPEHRGYIIEFKQEPIVKSKNHLQQKQILENEHTIAKNQFSLLISDFDNKIMNEFFVTFNGISLDITDDEANTLKNFDIVESVFKNYKVEAQLFDSVPLINADDVWALGYSGENMTIAIIDTGVDYTHPDLGGCFGYGCKVADGYDFVNNDNDPMDDNGHGTHCAGISASNGNLKGVAPNATLYAYKVLDNQGSGFDDDIVAGIERAVDPNIDGNFSDHVDVISMSLGVHSDYFNNCYDVASSDASDAATDAGVSVVVAAGNEGIYMMIRAPGCAKHVITVGATDKEDNLAAWFSSRGPTKDYRVKPDVVAPGVEICSAQWDDAWSWLHCYDDEHVAISGTSMATPHVSGTAALIKQAHPDWSPQEIKYALRNTAVDIGVDVLSQGYGRLDALASVTSEKPLIAILNTSGVVSGTVSLIGYIGPNITHYVISIGAGYSPDSWEIITESFSVPENEILTEFNTSFFNDGLYTIRLIADNLVGQNTSDATIIHIVNDNRSCYSCSDCTYKVNIPNNYIVLKNDLVFNWLQNKHCIEFESSDNVMLDCDRYSIYSEDGTHMNAAILNRRNNITIKNCNIPGRFSWGIYMLNAKNTTLLNNSLSGNYINILVDSTLYSLIYYNYTLWREELKPYFNHNIDTSNHVNGLPFFYYFNIHNTHISSLYAGGIYIVTSYNVSVKNSTITGDGVWVRSSDKINLSQNLIWNASWFGIHFTDSFDSVIKRNHIAGNSSGGIELFRSGRNLVVQNTLTENRPVLIALDSIRLASLSSNNTIFDNIITNNQFYHLLIFSDSALDNAIFHNSFYNNIWHEYDALSHSPVELSYNQQGNFWGRTEEPYFCEYDNQHPNCINNWDSNSPDVIDSCPYNQSYPPGEWPVSPVCPLYCEDGTPYDQCSQNKPLYCENGELISKCQQCGCPPNTYCYPSGICKKTQPEHYQQAPRP